MNKVLVPNCCEVVKKLSLNRSLKIGFCSVKSNKIKTLAVKNGPRNVKTRRY